MSSTTTTSTPQTTTTIGDSATASNTSANNNNNNSSNAATNAATNTATTSTNAATNEDRAHSRLNPATATKEQFMSLTRDNLEGLARTLGVVIGKKDTKEQLTGKIIHTRNLFQQNLSPIPSNTPPPPPTTSGTPTLAHTAAQGTFQTSILVGSSSSHSSGSSNSTGSTGSLNAIPADNKSIIAQLVARITQLEEQRASQPSSSANPISKRPRPEFPSNTTVRTGDNRARSGFRFQRGGFGRGRGKPFTFKPRGGFGGKPSTQN